MRPDTILIFTDGSSRGNPGPGGWGAIVAYDGKTRELGGGAKMTTNNRMEISAAIEALKFLAKYDAGDDEPIVVHTDSSYLVQGITKWVRGWARNDWMTATKEPVSNRDLWEQLVAATEKLEESHEIVWELVKGHVGVPGNERCDEIATAFADQEEIDLYDGARDAYDVDLSVVASKVKKEVSLEKKARSKAKAYSYLSLVNGKIVAHKTWAECEARVKGVSGAKFKKSVSAADEKRIMSEWGK